MGCESGALLLRNAVQRRPKTRAPPAPPHPPTCARGPGAPPRDVRHRHRDGGCVSRCDFHPPDGNGGNETWRARPTTSAPRGRRCPARGPGRARPLPPPRPPPRPPLEKDARSLPSRSRSCTSTATPSSPRASLVFGRHVEDRPVRVGDELHALERRRARRAGRLLLKKFQTYEMEWMWRPAGVEARHVVLRVR